jgi:hypothetical protein
MRVIQETAGEPQSPTDAQLIAQPLRQIANCLAFIAVNSVESKGKSKEDFAPILSSFGFEKKAIAALLQMEGKAVAARIKAAKRK